jgi:hypothetical protein
VFGFGGPVVASPLIPGAGYAGTTSLNPATGAPRNSSRTVLLRWPASIPDPEVKVGQWIADVTYERFQSVQGIPGVLAGRWLAGDYPYQRCDWYQIVKRTKPVAESAGVGLGASGYRCMTVWVSSPLKAQTLLSTSTGQPIHVNAALIAPNVVAVFPKVIYAH